LELLSYQWLTSYSRAGTVFILYSDRGSYIKWHVRIRLERVMNSLLLRCVPLFTVLVLAALVLSTVVQAAPVNDP